MTKFTKIITISIKLLYYSFNIVQYYWLTALICYGVICSDKTEESFGCGRRRGMGSKCEKSACGHFYLKSDKLKDSFLDVNIPWISPNSPHLFATLLFMSVSLSFIYSSILFLFCYKKPSVILLKNSSIT